MHYIARPAFIGIALAALAQTAAAQEDHSQHQMSPAMAEFSSQSHHYHGTGNFMFKYHYMRMTMKDLLDGRKNVSPSQALAAPYNYAMAPTTMSMNMHMMEGMYGMSESFAFMAMAQYLSSEMKMVATVSEGLPLEPSLMNAKGFGDTNLTLLYRANNELMTNFGLSLPSGAINLADNMPMNGVSTRTRLPYDMQLGSGTYDIKPSVTYALRNGPWGFGVQGEYTFRLGLNDYGYKLGNRRDAQAWASWAMNGNTEFSTRVELATWGQIKGADANIIQSMPASDNSMPGMDMGHATGMSMSPNADPKNSGGVRLTTFVGMSGKANNGNFGFSIEAGLPLYQRLTGLQMRTSSILGASMSVSF